MKPGEITAFLGSLYLPPLLVAVVLLNHRASEIAAALLILLGAVKAGSDVVHGQPYSPLGWRGALWVAAFFALISSALLGWGFFPATFLAAGYLSLTLFALAVLTPNEVWGSRASERSGRFIFFVLGLGCGAYTAAGALGWSPTTEVDLRSFATFPGPILVVLIALFKVIAGSAVWVRGLELRGGRWMRNGWTMSTALGLFGLAAAVAVGGLTGLSLFW
jgi:hypothetical protein